MKTVKHLMLIFLLGILGYSLIAQNKKQGRFIAFWKKEDSQHEQKIHGQSHNGNPSGIKNSTYPVGKN